MGASSAHLLCHLTCRSYKILREPVGKGTFGEVLRAERVENSKSVATKRSRPEEKGEEFALKLVALDPSVRSLQAPL